MSEVDKIQHGGDHYKSRYEHWNLVADLQLNYYVANATKYITRHRKKNGLEDVEKAGHYLQKYIELIQQGRMPAPIGYSSAIAAARTSLIEKFVIANGLDPVAGSGAALEARFLLFSANAGSVEDLQHAMEMTDFLASQYPKFWVPPGSREKDILIPMPPMPPPRIYPVPSNVAAAMDPQFAPEGYWGDMRVLWKCRKCNAYFQIQDGERPSEHHSCNDGSEPTAAYVNQG